MGRRPIPNLATPAEQDRGEARHSCPLPSGRGVTSRPDQSPVINKLSLPLAGPGTSSRRHPQVPRLPQEGGRGPAPGPSTECLVTPLSPPRSFMLQRPRRWRGGGGEAKDSLHFISSDPGHLQQPRRGFWPCRAGSQRRPPARDDAGPAPRSSRVFRGRPRPFPEPASASARPSRARTRRPASAHAQEPLPEPAPKQPPPPTCLNMLIGTPGRANGTAGRCVTWLGDVSGGGASAAPARVKTGV